MANYAAVPLFRGMPVIWQTSADETVLLVDQAAPSGVTDEIPCPPSAILTTIYKTMYHLLAWNVIWNLTQSERQNYCTY